MILEFTGRQGYVQGYLLQCFLFSSRKRGNKVNAHQSKMVPWGTCTLGSYAMKDKSDPNQLP